MADDPRDTVRGTDVVEEFNASGALDSPFDKIDTGEIDLTGDGWLIPGLMKPPWTEGCRAELTDPLAIAHRVL